MSHIVDSCPVYKFEGGLASLHTASDFEHVDFRGKNTKVYNGAYVYKEIKNKC